MSTEAMAPINPETRLYIDGKLVTAASGKTYNNINPADGSVAGVCADAVLKIWSAPLRLRVVRLTRATGPPTMRSA
jgi:hypothetical protein